MTTQHRDNLRKLADHLDALPADYEHFDMAVYCDNEDDDDLTWPRNVTVEKLHACGTTACALGHGPTIPGCEAMVGETWNGYARRVFGIFEWSDEWDYAFGPMLPNDPKFIASRIRDIIGEPN